LRKHQADYYFRTKEALYRRVLAETLALWVNTAEVIGPEADPKAALSAYVAAKIEFSGAGRMLPRSSPTRSCRARPG
jgi:TetR/AcrR family transcriptional regulator